MKWTAPQLSIMQAQYSKCSHADLAKLLGRSKKSIGAQAIRMGLAAKRPSYTVDHSFFSDVDRQLPAYWLGFLWADGNVYGSRITVNLARKDMHHLRSLASDLQTDAPVELYTSHSAFGKRKCRLRVSSTQLASDLARLNVVPNKSCASVRPRVPRRSIWHFIRGLFDGDGSVGKSHTNNGLQVRICGTKATCSWLRDTLHFGNVYKDNGKELFVWAVSSNHDVSIVGNKMYADAKQLLHRKFLRFQEAGYVD